VIKKILVCIEGSPSGERAIETAIQLARQLGAELTGLAIVDEPDIRAGAATSIGGGAYKRQRDDALLEDAQKQSTEWLVRFIERCREQGIAAQPLTERGKPAATILEEMKSYDLTLMGRHANFTFETAAQDRQTRDAVLHHARSPVMVIPESARLETNKVLMAFDGSSASKRAVRTFAESGLAAGADVHVGSAEDDGTVAWEMATRAVEMLKEYEIRGQQHSIVSTLPIAEAILQLRERLGAGLIVMGAYTRSRLSELIWGSVTGALIAGTPVPLYLHH
jgi:nucleotide-binding universal stress UspA family protein